MPGPHRRESAPRIAGFEVGADDDVVKPFSVREVVLRVQGLVRRMSERIEELLAEVWKIQETMSTRTVDVHVQRRRQALGAASDLIETVTGFGSARRADGGDRASHPRAWKPQGRARRRRRVTGMSSRGNKWAREGAAPRLERTLLELAAMRATSRLARLMR